MNDEPPRPPRLFVVAVAASLGGIPAITQVLAALTPDFPGAILIVQHLERHRVSQLAEILGRRTPMPVKEAEEGEAIRAGTVYIAPPDRHLLVRPDGVLTLTRTALVQFVRPSADSLFESVADSFGPRAVAVILSGTGHDGLEGVQKIRRKGGTVIAQSFESAAHYGMPGGAIEGGFVDRVLPLEQIAPALEALAGAETGG